MSLFPLIPVAPWLMLVLNIVLWPIYHLAISKITLHTPDHRFQQDTWLYKEKPWEKQGRFYEDVLRIRAWKKFIPDGATLFNEGFKKKQLQGTQQPYLIKFIEETRRAEYSHLLQIIPCVTFFIFNDFWIAMIMVAYALLFNIPLIWVQRYNRIRFQRLVKRL